MYIDIDIDIDILILILSGKGGFIYPSTDYSSKLSIDLSEAGDTRATVYSSTSILWSIDFFWKS